MEYKEIRARIDRNDFVILQSRNFNIDKLVFLMIKAFANKVDGDLGLVAEIEYLREMIRMAKLDKESPEYIKDLESTLEIKNLELKNHLKTMKYLAHLRELDLLIAKHGQDYETIRKNSGEILKNLGPEFNLKKYINNRVLEDISIDNYLVDFMLKSILKKKKPKFSDMMKNYN